MMLELELGGLMYCTVVVSVGGKEYRGRIKEIRDKTMVFQQMGRRQRELTFIIANIEFIHEDSGW